MSGIRDIGTIDEPLLVFGGPYGNAQALDALLEAAAQHGIPPRRMLCTGDLTAYAADPQYVVDRIREADISVVMGNVEESLGSAAADCNCGFTEGSRCNALSARWFAYARDAVSAEAQRWMGTLPCRIDFRMSGRRFAAVHGAVSRINRFVFPATARRTKAVEIELAGTDAVLAGHSGVPFSQRIGRRLWHNAGVIGLPANDGTPRVWYAILQPNGEAVTVENHALHYDHRTAAARIRAVGLPEAYATALGTGLWPDDDIMPPADRRCRGTALRPRRLVWRGLPTSSSPARAPSPSAGQTTNMVG